MFVLNFLFGNNPEPSSVQNQKLGILGKHCAAIEKLKTKEFHKERTSQIRKIGAQILNEGRKWQATDWRQFGLMLNCSIIRHTDMEGGFIEASVAVWRYFFEKWKKGEGPFFDIRLTDEQFAALFAALDDLDYFQSLLPHSASQPLDDKKVENIAKKFQKALRERLQSQGSVYLPLGYRHGLTSEGHAITCKLELHNDGYITCHPLNLGNGSENHPVLNYTTSQEKVSFRHYPFEIEPAHFWGKYGLSAFCHLIRYLADPPQPDHDHYRGEDLLDIFYLLGPVVPTLGKRPESFEAKSQTAGNCSEMGVQNVIHDVLIELKISKEKTKLLFLNMRLCTLVRGYHSYKRSPCEKNRYLLTNAAEEFGIALQKMRPSGYEAASAIVDKIKYCTEKPIRKPSSKAPGRENTIVKIEHFPSLFPDITGIQDKDKRPLENNLSTKRAPFPEFNLATFAADLDHWIQAVKELKPEIAYQFLDHLSSILPLPAWNQEDLWDKLSPQEASLVIHRLEMVVKLCLKEYPLNKFYIQGSFIRQVITFHTFYIIIDKLARKCPWTKLHGFASPFIPFIYHYDPSDFSAIPLGEENHRYCQISDYFKKSAEEGLVIFPIEPLLSIENYVYDSTHGGEPSLGRNHILFLQRHIYDQNPSASNVSLLPLYFEGWLNMESSLSAELITLYYFAYLSAVLFLSEGATHSFFPQNLKFLPTQDEQGKKALIIETFEQHLHYTPDAIAKRAEAEREQWGPHYGDPTFCRLRELDYHPIMQPFPPLPDNCPLPMQTNDAVCARLSEENAKKWDLTESIYRDLLRINCQKNLRLPLAVHWATTHPIQLSSHSIQFFLSRCFFAPPDLYEQLKEEPTFIDAMRAMVKVGLDYYGNNGHHLNTLLFLIRTGIYCETHLIALFGPKESEKVLEYYQERLEKLLENIPYDSYGSNNEIYACLKLNWLVVQVHRSNRSHAETFKLLKIFAASDDYPFILRLLRSDMRHAMHPNDRAIRTDWFRNRKDFLARTLLIELKEKLSDEKLRNSFCSDFLRFLLPQTANLTGEWSGNFPEYQCGEYTFDFLNFELKEREKGKLNFDSKYWIKDGHEESLDGRFRKNYDEELQDWNFERKILLGNTLRWGKWLNFKSENRPELRSLCTTDFKHLILNPLSPDSKEREIISFDRQDRPVLRIDCVGNQKMQIIRTDEQGNPLPIHLANLSEIRDKDDPLFQFVLRFSTPESILCFINIETREIEELHFVHYSLQFKRNDSGLESKEHPGFYLQLSETVEELDHFQAAMVLVNDQDEKKVLLPAVKLKSKTENFIKEIELTDNRLFEEKNESSFLYDIDSIDGTLHHKAYVANLYLALILKLQGNEVRALKYLRRATPHRSFTKKEIGLLSLFTTFSDASPSALAFYGKLLFIVADNVNLLLENQFGSGWHLNECRALLTWGQRIYINYLKSISREELSAIARDLRLEQEEEKAILRTLKRQAEKYKQALPQILQLRHKLLVAEQKELTVTISPKTFSKRPPIFASLIKPQKISSLWISDDRPFPYGKHRLDTAEKWDNLTLPDFPNRLSALQIELHFPQLYERARQCKKGVSNLFDFTLLACLKVKNYHYKDRGRELAHLLFYVRHFPHLFQNLSLLTGTDSEKIETFNNITKQVSLLKNREEFNTFTQDYLKEKTEFKFSKEIKLTLPETTFAPLVERSKSQDLPSDKIRPFVTWRRLLFIREAYFPALPQLPPFLDPTLAPQPGTLESEIRQRFIQGYENLKKRKSYHYIFIEKQLPTVEKQLQKEKVSWHQKIIYLRQKIITAANAPYQLRIGQVTGEQLHEELDHKLRTQTGQNLTLLPEMIMKEAVLKNNPAFLKKHSPLLTLDEIEEILNQTRYYYYLLTLYQVAKESLALIERVKNNPADQASIDQLANLLDYNFLDFEKYPEVFYFKVTEGKLLRKKQAEIHKWVCEGLEQKKRVGFQQEAGGGKTEVLAPLFTLRAQKYGLMPLFLSTQMMYAIDKKNLGYTLTKLDQQLCYLEVGLHMRLSAEDYQLIFEQLKQYHHEGRSLIMTPQTDYALRLQYKFAGIKEKDALKVKYLALILNFFETKCLQIGDEAHKNYDPLTRAIYGIGDFFQIPKEENVLFLEMMKPLLGFETLLCDNGMPISQVAKLEKNLVGTPTPEEMVEIQKSLATHMSHSKLLAIPEIHRKEFVHYWTDPKVKQPDYLKKIAKQELSRAHLLALTGNFILYILPQIVNLRTELDHGQSIFQEEEFETPFHHKTPSAAQYEDYCLTSPLSIKGTSHRGLSQQQFRNLITKLLSKDLEEQKEIYSRETDSAQLFKQWILATQDPSIAALQLTDISVNDAKLMETLFQHLSKNSLVLDYYLTYIVLPQVGYCLEQLTVTPAHMMNGSNRTIIGTATPLSEHIYPQALDWIRYDPFFEAEAISELCKPKNQHRIEVDAPESFFTQMEKEFKEEFSKCDVFLDPKGFFCDLPNDEVARKWLAASQLDGVLYFKEGRTLQVDKDEKICILFKQNQNGKDSEKIIELDGSNIKEALCEYHLDLDQLRIGTYYDASHTESANITQKVKTTAFIFIGDNLPISRLIQALMRLRGLLDEKMIQNVISVYPKEVAKKIPKSQSGSIDGAALFAWCVKNEAEELKKRVILKGFQEIAFQIESPALNELKEHLYDPEKQINVFQKYSKGFVEYKPHNPYASFGDHELENFSETVLMDFAKAEYQKYGYSIPLTEDNVLFEQISTIIQVVKKRVAKISTQIHKKAAEIEKQSHQIRHTQLHKQVKQKDYRPRPFEPLSAEMTFGTINIDTPNFPHMIHVQNARAVFQTDGLTKNFYFDPNQLKTAKNNGVSMGIDYLKPIDFFLIVLSEELPPMAIAQCNEINQTTLHDLTKKCCNPEVTHQVFIVSASGKLLQRGKGFLAPDEQKLQEILDSKWMKDLVIDAALLSGQIAHPDRLLKRIKKWKNFSNFWTTIVKAQPNPETANQRVMSRLLS